MRKFRSRKFRRGGGLGEDTIRLSSSALYIAADLEVVMVGPRHGSRIYSDDLTSEEGILYVVVLT